MRWLSSHTLARWLLACALVGSLGSCVLSPATPVERDLLALSPAGFVPVATPPQVRAWLKTTSPWSVPGSPRVLHVYLEGDGAPWWAQRLPPADPTPRASVALPLALSDPHNLVAYLGRPCQYLLAPALSACPVEWWTSGRWSDPVVTLALETLDRLKQASGAQQVVITGHSGGGSLALLMAARRRDVRCVLTLASPLDLQAWTQLHGVAPLVESLNPADIDMAHDSLDTRHVFGLEDPVVPLASMGRYSARLHPDQVISVPHLGHVQGWVSWWQANGTTQHRLSAWLQGCLHPA